MKSVISFSVCALMLASVSVAQDIPAGGVPAISENLPQALKFRGEMENYMEKAIRQAPEPPLDWAVTLRTTQKYGNFWSSVIYTPSSIDLQKNDVMLLAFRARTIQPAPDEEKGRFMSYLEVPEFNHAKPLRSWTTVGDQWESVFFPFVMNHDVKAGNAFLSFGMQDGPQEVEIADVQLLTYRQKIDFDDLPATTAAARPETPYLSKWNQQAQEYIKEIRSRSDQLEETLLDSLEPEHPRLMLTPAHVKHLKKLIAEQPSMPATYYPRLIDQADDLLSKSLIDAGERSRRGNILHKSREMVKRMQVWGMAWQLSGQKKYAERARREMLHIAGFDNWDPAHFLDVAEMTNAMAIGYDWCYDALDADARKTIRQAIIEKGLQEGILHHRTGKWWTRCDHNWNQVCNFGLIVGALAVADTDPEPAKQIIMYALESIPRALVMYNPEGAWTEGPGYWGYATTYSVYGLLALETALHKDFGLSEFSGFSKTGQFPIYTAGPTRYYMCFADCGRGKLRDKPLLLYFARRYGDRKVARWEYEQIEQYGPDLKHLLFYTDPPSEGLPQLDLDRMFDGPVPVATFRSAWNDDNALFVGVKGGYNRVNHGHLDLGNFELDALGVRWALDLGGDSYSLPAYFSGGPNAKRWTYYRCNSKSHNVPEIAGHIQNPEATAQITRFQSHPESGFAVLDLSEGYATHANSVTRGIAMLEGRRTALVQDEFDLKQPADIAWGFTTTAAINLSDPRDARLTADGQAIRVRLLSPQDAEFIEESAEQQPPQKQNKGVRRLMIRYRAPTTKPVFRVQFVPEWPDQKRIPDASQQPIAEWQ